jgi:pyruvate-formate lyase-activating enzyme
MNKQRLEVYEFRETESCVTHTFGERATRERNEPDVARDAKAQINHCVMDTNEEVQDRCSGRLSKCGA